MKINLHRIFHLFMSDYVYNNYTNWEKGPIVHGTYNPRGKIYRYNRKDIFVCTWCGKKKEKSSYLGYLDLPDNIEIPNGLSFAKTYDKLIRDNIVK